VVGAVDDMRGLPVAPRFLLQALAVGAVIAALPPEWRVLAPLPWWAERALLLVAGLWFVNLVNFMDGIDWMTVAETIPLTLGLVLVGIAGALPPAAIVVALALGGATAGFAPFNRPVARLFLGDVGSLPIGLMLCWLLLLLAARGHVAAALLLPLYYLADATITLARRIVQGEAVWQAHRSHFYQRATERYSVMQVVTRVFVANLGLAALAFVAVIADHAAIDAAALACGAAFVTWLLVDFARSGR
jgi:UDP-N-acetylmuramyl pentapeptide phosphotransferase/UDP-N-acetylglucosamine-1-phosphate transferase